MYEGAGDDESPVPVAEQGQVERALAESENDANRDRESEDAVEKQLLQLGGDDGADVAKVKSHRKKAPDLPAMERRNYLLHYHYIRGESDTCKSLIKEIRDETQGQCEFALQVEAQLLRQEGDVQKSLDVFQQCAALNPEQPAYVKEIGRSLFLLGKQSDAVNVFDEALKMKNTDWEVHHWKARCYRLLKDNAKAKESLAKAAKLNKHEETFRLLGELATAEGDLMTAIEAYRRALDVAPEDTALLTALGLLYLETGSQQQGFEALGRALALRPNQPQAILAAGAMMQQHADFDVALTKYRVAAHETPDSAQLWNNIAMCFYGKKKLVAAISCLKRANYLAPLDWKILYNLGLAHLGMMQYASAFHFLSGAINLQPKVAAIYVALAVALTALEDATNARKAYEKAALLDKVEPSIALNLAIFYYKQGDQASAVEWLNNFEGRLIVAKEQQAGISRINREVVDTADKMSALLRGGGNETQGTSSLAAPPPDTESVASLNSRNPAAEEETALV